MPETGSSSKCLNKVQEAINFMMERMVALIQIIEPDTSPDNISALYYDENGRRVSHTMLMDVARGFARSVPMIKLIHMDSISGPTWLPS